jgi:hypothetical protein
MKVKRDFVTNSSTTSYIMLGYVVKVRGKDRLMEVDDLEEKAEKLGYQIFVGGEDGAPNDETALVGEIIGEMNSEECGFEEKEIDFEELLNKVNQLKVNLGLPVNWKLKVICSTRMS